MNEGANLIAQNCENSPTTLEAENQPVSPLSTTTVTTGRRPRFGTGSVPASPFYWVDGKQIRSALATHKKWPPRRVSFPTNDMHLVTSYLEPANPWEHAENVSREDLISTYKKSCIQHNIEPLESVIAQLEKLEISQERSGELSLRGQTLEQNHCESLEEILKRVQFNKIDLERTSLNDESSVALFDMLEYYESATHLNISYNQDIGARGWQACSRMIKKTQCLEQLDAKNVTLNEQHMPILSRALRLGSHLHVLKLQNCGLAGRPIIILAAALKLNTGLKELYLADNDLGPQDAMQLGVLLRINNHLQLLDVSNNNIQDIGVGHISDGLIEQPNDDKEGKGLGILVLWNNHLTRNSSQHFSRAIARSKTLETLNVGQNALTNEMLHIIKDSLLQNHVLLRLGMQSTHLTCEGALALAEVIEDNRVLQRIDLRDNNIQTNGLKALAAAMKKNRSVTQLDLDDRPRKQINGTTHQYKDLVAEIRNYCTRNEEPRSPDESIGDSDSPQHRSRLSSMNSRKISLTCQTLPNSSPVVPQFSPDGSGRSLLEPKRTSGGRLRSPAPSPIPSPVASPIPSPSRSRFVVSRVPEDSLSSTNSSASSSPVTPPSLGSSPTRFFPSTSSGSSRFRVTVVKPEKSVKPATKSVITSVNTNITVGFKFKADETERTYKPDNVIVDSNSSAIGRGDNEEPHVDRNVNSSLNVNDNSMQSKEVTVKVKKTSENRCIVTDIIDVESETSERDDVERTETYGEREPDATAISKIANTEGPDSNDVRKIITGNDPMSTDIENVPTRCSDDENDTATAALPQLRSISRSGSSLQKHTSSLERLLGLFQHPGNFFSSSLSVDRADVESRLQDSVNSVVALGDKFQQYLREGRGGGGSGETCHQIPLQRSASDAARATSRQDPVKSSSVPQLSSIQALNNVFASCRLDPAGTKLPTQCGEKDANEHDDNPIGSSCATSNVCYDVVESSNVEDSTSLPSSLSSSCCERDVEAATSRLSDQPLPDSVQSKECYRRINDSADSNAPVDTGSSEIFVNSASENNKAATLCAPKLKDIPEYSVLEISNSEDDGKDERQRICVTTHDGESIGLEICDSGVTDSINPTSSDRNYSTNNYCNVSCVVRNVDNIYTTVSTLDNVRSLVNVASKCNDDDEESNATRSTRCVDCEFGEDRVDCARNAGTTGLLVDDNNGNENVLERERHELENVACSKEDRNAFACRTDCNSTSVIDRVIGSSAVVLDNNFNNNVSDIKNDDVDIGGTTVYDEKTGGTSNSSEIVTEDESFVADDFDRHGELSLDKEETDEVVYQEEEEEEEEEKERVEKVDLSHRESPRTLGAVNIVTKKEESLDFDKSDIDDLIFHMTDITTDYSNFVSDDEISSSGATRDRVDSSSVSFDECRLESHSSQASRSPTSLFIERSRSGLHRNSHDSGIEESNASMSDDNVPEGTNQPVLQASVDSGIDSECPTVCVKVEDSACMDVRKDNDVVTMREVVSSKNVQDDSTERSMAKIEACQSHVEIVRNMVVTSVRSSRKEIKATNSILQVQVNTEGRDSETSGCSAVVCSTSPE